MPATTIRLFCDATGAIPMIDWLAEIEARDEDAYAKCLNALLQLEQSGYELRRPLSDALRDGIRELRVRHKRLNYRILYFFHAQNVVVLSHGLTKESEIPPKEIEKAIARHRLVTSDPEKYLAAWRV